MSSSNTLFNGLTYLDNLGNVLNKTAPTTDFSAYVTGFVNDLTARANGLDINEFFTRYKFFNFPVTLDNVARAFDYWVNNHEQAVTDPNPPPTFTGDSALQNAVKQIFIDFYKNLLQITNESDTYGDWNAVDTTIIDQLPILAANQIGDFLRNYPYSRQTSGALNTSILSFNEFTTNFANYLIQTATLSPLVQDVSWPSEIATYNGVQLVIDPDTIFLNAANHSTTAKNDYLSAYAGYFPPPQPGQTDIFGNDLEQWIANYKKALNDFMMAGIQKVGYFDPGRNYGEWVSEIRNDYMNQLSTLSIPPSAAGPGAAPGSGGGSSVNTDPNRKLAMLDNIFLLIIKILGNLQQVAAAQSNRLNLYSSWTQEYVNRQNQIHAFFANNGDYIDAPKGEDNYKTPNGFDKPDGGDQSKHAVSIRNDLNNTINANFTEQLKNNRGVINDESKALQSTVNATSDAVSQQTNIADTIIQQLSTLLSAIFK